MKAKILPKLAHIHPQSSLYQCMATFEVENYFLHKIHIIQSNKKKIQFKIQGKNYHIFFFLLRKLSYQVACVGCKRKKNLLAMKICTRQHNEQNKNKILRLLHYLPCSSTVLLALLIG